MWFMHLPRLLLVDDDRSIARALALALRNTYTVDIAGDGELALGQTAGRQYAAIILDLNLPGLPGLEVCRRLREAGVDCPILVLSGESEVLTKITLLDAGANDYLTKPFSLGELKARLRTLLRNQRSARHLPRRLAACGLLLDRRTHAVTRGGVSIRLRRKEFALLECLMEHAGSVVTRAALIRHGWQGAEQPWTNTVDVHIKYLRDKLDRPFDQPVIQTVHGLGYRLGSAPVPPDNK
jgi:DNA-binding response OmpR family regulator